MRRTSIGLLANRSLRSGPRSQLISFLREFEHYFRHVLNVQLYVVDGTYRAILKAGLFRDYSGLHRVSAGHHGGIVPITAMAVRTPDNPERKPYVDSVIYFIDPRDPTSTYPESAALKRECVVAKKPFLATYSAAHDWASLAWFASDDLEKEKYFLDAELLRQLAARGNIAAARTGIHDQTIALIAHDKKKKEMLGFALENLDLLQLFHSRQATGTTGTLLNGDTPLPSRLSAEEMKTLEPEFGELAAAVAGGKLEKWFYAQPSGPRGGDVQIAELVLSSSCHKVVFFEDPHVSREHEADIQLLERTCRIPEINITSLHDYTTATEWATNLRTCLQKGAGVPLTLYRAFKLLFDVELVLPSYDVNDNDEKSVWRAILETAAYFLLGAVATAARVKADIAEKARLAVTWGYAMHELCEAIQTAGADLQKLGAELEVDPPLVGRHYLSPGNIITVPMVGIMGTTDPRVEATRNAAVLKEALAGTAVPLSCCAFVDRKIDVPGESILSDWETADIAVFTCEMLRPQFGSKALAPMPPLLFDQMRDQAVGEIGGIFLNEDGGEISPREYTRVGMTYHQLQRIAKRGGAILMAGAQPQRVQPALACLRGKLVSTFITNRGFAWEVLRAELLPPPAARQA